MLTTKRSIKEISKNLLLLVSTFIILFFFAEGVIILFNLVPPNMYQIDDNLGWILKPTMAGILTKPEYIALMQTNSKGLADTKEYPYEKPIDTFRIIFLGGSFPESFQVNPEESFHYLLEEKLNSGKKNFEVINMGVGNFGTDQAYMYWLEEGYKYNSDLVILFVGSDIEKNIYEIKTLNKPYFKFEDNGLKKTAWSSHNVPLLKRIFWSKFRLYNFISMNIKNSKSIYSLFVKLGFVTQDIDRGEIPSDFLIYAREYDSTWQNAMSITEKIIVNMKNDLDTRGIKFLEVIYPDRLQISGEVWDETLETYPKMKGLEWDLEKPNRLIVEFSKKNQIAYLDLLPPLREYVNKSNELPYYKYDGHWNKKGHEIVSEMLYKKLEEMRIP